LAGEIREGDKVIVDWQKGEFTFLSKRTEQTEQAQAVGGTG
jgi:hypothetical protein